MDADDLKLRNLTEICEQFVISEATAKTHVARILPKLDLRDRVQAVIYAYETRLVAPARSADQPALSQPSSPCAHGTALPRSKTRSFSSPAQTPIVSLSG